MAPVFAFLTLHCMLTMGTMVTIRINFRLHKKYTLLVESTAKLFRMFEICAYIFLLNGDTN